MAYWIISLLIAITIHEYSHGYVSYKLGDPTPKEQGRLTLNPLKHIDPVGLIFLIILGFGWAAPIRVNASYYKNEKKGLMLVALAGPLSNFTMAIIGLLIGVILKSIGLNIIELKEFITTFVSINIILGIFNLIPLPPLDGSKILGGFLPKSFEMNEKIGFMLLIFLMFSGTLSKFLNIIYMPILKVLSSII